MKFTTFDPDTVSHHAEASEDRAAPRAGTRSSAPTIGDVIAQRFERRDVLRGALGFTAIAATVGPMALAARPAHAKTGSFDFEEIAAKVTDNHEVAPGYDAKVLIRWGDPVLPEAPEFDPANQTAAAQAKQFGYNNDYVGFFPHPDAPDDANRGVIVVHHEYTNEELMFPGLGRQDRDANFASMTKELVDIEMAAHGGTVIEVKRGGDGAWSTDVNGRLNRRIDANTEMSISGPAAGHEKMKTNADATGTKVFGTINNCAGGQTPWGTWLMAEENFNGYFSGPDGQSGEGLEDDPVKALYARYGVPGRWYSWADHHDRFDVTKEPNEPNRFGWIVEVDPSDPTSTPVKRTALGRFKHEGAGVVKNKDGRIVVFMGDDQRFDYVYRFVSNEPWDDANPDRDILDKGTLSVARYEADGKIRWLPLKHGEGKLTAENGFADQGDVLVQTRRAADFLEATPMDRPEDVDANADDGTVYVMLTNNTKRKPGDENPANPRPENRFGHIIEMIAPDKDFAADEMKWEILVKCGDPAVTDVGATFSTATTKDGWFANPDNCVVDPDGRLWISTDGNSGADTGRSDGLWSMETSGEGRGTSRHFFRCPAGAELCGPTFTPDSQALFLAIQHPADDGKDWPEFGRTSTFDDPSTRWPDFKDGMPPRPSVVVVTKQGGGKIG